ncbi:acylneuraminate cytidylyltransferase family protein [Nitrincola iocasae]|uniref:Acylneuraminate cytidylyltransferase family protein n=2 Tax=Nitrincola iocasae TaxID=2614693 RepID=A0A5J6LB63_9GAMM|nr:acylneuraminate cytidylyltransferase family protein [Nitrincola iocasae]
MDLMVNRRIAIIPARGGSKRIPEKNIIDFAGKPMIAWSIEAALKSNLFDRVIVSTDDIKIADIAKQWGAEVPFLRKECADDYSTVSEATTSALTQAMNFWHEDYTTVVQLMANCPLRTSNDIQQATHQFDRQHRRFQISCFKYGWMNPWWAVKLNENNCPEKLFPDALDKRSQDLPELYCPTGAIWIAAAQDLLKHNTFYGPDHTFEPISWESAVDIDDFNDLAFAKSVLLNVQNYSITVDQ